MPTPALAESWSASPDGLTWSFRIRPNVFWSDGQPLTSADAVFTFNAILDPKTASPRRSTLATVASFDAPDPGSFRVTLKSLARS